MRQLRPPARHPLPVLLAVAATLLAHQLSSQEPGPRHVMRPSTEGELTLDPRSYHTDRLILKLREGFRVRLIRKPVAAGPATASSLTSPDELDLGSLRHVLGATAIERLFTRPVDDLDRERREILRRLPHDAGPPADLNNYYRVFTGGGQSTLEKMAALLSDPAVETVFPEFRLEAILQAQGRMSIHREPNTTKRSAPLAPPWRTPFFETFQLHLLQSPFGLGHTEALGILGALGNPRQVVAQLEALWIFGHEDLPQLVLSNVIGSTKFGTQFEAWRHHGTAAVGILHASRDHKGVRGYVPQSKLFVSSIVNGYGNMVSLATAKAGPGDVFTSSLVFGSYYKGRGYHTPFDWPQDAYDAIRNATLKGIVTTIAAGNTGTDLATKPIYGTRYLPSSTPSGAIICGATFGPEQKRAVWSNYGERVEANAWGALVTTTAYGHIWRSQQGRQSYTNQFGGTSAAAPQVAGVLASIQSVAKIHKDKALSPRDLKLALRSFGVPIDGDIGVRPNLIGTLKRLGLWSGLRVLNEPKPGRTARLELDLEPGEVYTVLASTHLMRIPTGLSFPLLLNPATTVLVNSGRMPGGGSEDTKGSRRVLAIRVPSDPRLHRQKIYFQAVRSHHAFRLDLTNVAVAFVR